MRAEIFRGMKFSDIGPDLADEIGGLFEIGLFGRIRIEPEIAQRRRQDIVGGIQHVNAAVLELCQILRLEHDVPAVDLGVRPEHLLRHLDVIADAGGAPHVVGAVVVVGIVGGEPLGHDRPGVGEVRQLRLVEFQKHFRGDLALQEIAGGNHDVVAGFAGQQPRLQRLVGIKGVVDHLDAGFLGKVLQHPRRHVVRPVVEIDGALLRLRGRAATGPRRQRRSSQWNCGIGRASRYLLRRCTASDSRSSAVSSVASFLEKQNRTTDVTASCS